MADSTGEEHLALTELRTAVLEWAVRWKASLSTEAIHELEDIVLGKVSEEAKLREQVARVTAERDDALAYFRDPHGGWLVGDDTTSLLQRIQRLVSDEEELREEMGQELAEVTAQRGALVDAATAVAAMMRPHIEYYQTHTTVPFIDVGVEFGEALRKLELALRGEG